MLRELGTVRELGEGFKRIYQFLASNDLVPPELIAESDSFSITMHHRSVFSPVAQRWLGSFDRFSLDNQERKIILLGQTGELLSAADVYEAAEIPEQETERYRQLVERLQLKGLLRSMLTARQISAKAAHKVRRGGEGFGSGRRDVKRYKLYEPHECDDYYADLLRALQRAAPQHDAILSIQSLEEVKLLLLPTSPYRTNLARSLLLLGLVDTDRRRTAARPRGSPS